MSSLPPFSLPGWSMLTNPLLMLPKAINHLLKGEPWARAKLVPHAGKALLFVMAPFELRLAVAADGYAELAKTEDKAAVRIELPLSVLPGVLANGQSAAMKDVKLEGDAEFAQDVLAVAQALRWEPEEDLSRLVGDAAAHRIHRGMSGLAREAVRVNERLAENVSEYFLEEDRQLVRPRDVEGLATDLRGLRDDLARIEKRIERIERTARPAQAGSS